MYFKSPEKFNTGNFYKSIIIPRSNVGFIISRGPNGSIFIQGPGGSENILFQILEIWG